MSVSPRLRPRLAKSNVHLGVFKDSIPAQRKNHVSDRDQSPNVMYRCIGAVALSCLGWSSVDYIFDKLSQITSGELIAPLC